MHKRILTAIPLILIVLFILFYTSQHTFLYLSSLVFLYAAFEWGRLVGLNPFQQCLFLFATIFLFLLMLFINTLFVILPSLAWWCFVPVILFVFSKQNKVLLNYRTWILIIGCFVLTAAWASLNTLRAEAAGSWLVLFNLSLVWAADSVAYFAGRRWGKHFLAPKISPQKTLEGVAGALLASVILSLLGASFFKMSDPISLFKFAILGLIVGCASVVGDLYESLLKRLYHVKDSGSLLPGHGGLLDRIDGLLAATPFFTIGIHLLLR